MTAITYWRAVLRQARAIHRAAQAGDVVVTVPHHIAGRANAAIWQMRVEEAAERWEARAHDVSLPEWQAATRRRLDAD